MSSTDRWVAVQLQASDVRQGSFSCKYVHNISCKYVHKSYGMTLIAATSSPSPPPTMARDSGDIADTTPAPAPHAIGSVSNMPPATRPHTNPPPDPFTPSAEQASESARKLCTLSTPLPPTVSTVANANTSHGFLRSPRSNEPYLPRSEQSSVLLAQGMESLSSAHRRRSRFAFAIIMVTIVIFVAVLVYYSTLAIVGSHRTFKTSKRPNLCKTADCIVHSRFLTERVARNVDPCEDFEDHVCSVWRELEHVRDEQAGSAVGDVRTVWYENLESLLRKATMLIKASRKPLAMFHSCMQKLTASPSDVALFRSFMGKLRLSWPEEPPDGVKPLGVLLDLTFNWGLCFWLRIRMSKKPGSALGSRIRIMLSPGQSAAVYTFAMRYYRLVIEGTYARYWRRLKDLLNSEESSNDSGRINRSQTAEGKVINLLVSMVNKHPVDPVSVALSNISFFTHPVPSNEWLGQLNSVLRYKRPLNGDDEVLASDRILLNAIGKLFAMLSHGELLSHLSWQFVQAYAPILDLRLGDFITDRDFRIFCAAQVSSSYNPLIMAIYTRLYPPQKNHRYLTSNLIMVLKHTVQKIVRSTHLDNITKTTATSKLMAMNVRLWPVGELLRNPDRIYSGFPENGDSFVRLWIHTRLSLRSMVGTPYGDVAFSFSVVDSPLLMQYDYLMNQLDISAVVLTRPLYYSDGTNAMFYGGLGFLVAEEVLKTQDAVGARFHPNGSVVPFWIYKNARKLLDNHETCLGARNKLGTFLPALEVAYSAFREATQHEKQPMQLSDELTEPKVFFKTVCLTTCAMRGFGLGVPLVDCNQLVKNSPEFVATFGCKKVSRMNSPNKCPYFQ
nr:uncharacterized protein LOC126522986 [Dermacentor andersoni]